jgi:hypothetical protein
MLTTLTILSPDQGKIYSPPADQFDERTIAEIGSFSRSIRIAEAENHGLPAVPTPKTIGFVHFLLGLAVSIFGPRVVWRGIRAYQAEGRGYDYKQ